MAKHQSITMSSVIALDPITIAALFWQSVASFNRLLDHFKRSSEDPPDTLPDDLGRLKVWAENVGVELCRSITVFADRLEFASRSSCKLSLQYPFLFS
jgi:hypothetical protein